MCRWRRLVSSRTQSGIDDSIVNTPRGHYRWSQPAERNQGPILERLQPLLTSERTWRVLEVGSGTGQHAVHFANHLPHVQWLTSDLADYHQTLNAYLDEAGPVNVQRPLLIDAQSLAAIDFSIDMIYTANTLHIMSWENVLSLFQSAGSVLTAGNRIVLYGPFHVGGRATSDGNHRFDLTLSQTNPWQGIRNREDVIRCADQSGFSLIQRFDMPANNQLLILERRRDCATNAKF